MLSRTGWAPRELVDLGFDIVQTSLKTLTLLLQATDIGLSKLQFQGGGLQLLQQPFIVILQSFELRFIRLGEYEPNSSSSEGRMVF